MSVVKKISCPCLSQRQNLIDFSSALSAEEFNGFRGRKNSIGVTGMWWTSQKMDLVHHVQKYKILVTKHGFRILG